MKEGIQEDQSYASSHASSFDESRGEEFEEELPPFLLNPIAGSFADCARPIHFSPSSGEGPLSILPVVQEGDDENESKKDSIVLDKKDKAYRFSVNPIEDATISTVGTGDDATSKMQSPQRSLDSHTPRISGRPPLSISRPQIQVRENKCDVGQNDSREREEKSKMDAIYAMKDVIFKQRSTIKKTAREKHRLKLKYLQRKEDNKELQQRNNALEKELEELRSRLETATKHDLNNSYSERVPVREVTCLPVDEDDCLLDYDEPLEL